MDAIVDGSKTPVVREQDIEVENLHAKKPKQPSALIRGPVTIRIAKGLPIAQARC